MLKFTGKGTAPVGVEVYWHCFQVESVVDQWNRRMARAAVGRRWNSHCPGPSREVGGSGCPPTGQSASCLQVYQWVVHRVVVLGDGGHGGGVAGMMWRAWMYCCV